MGLFVVFGRSSSFSDSMDPERGTTFCPGLDAADRPDVPAWHGKLITSGRTIRG